MNITNRQLEDREQSGTKPTTLNACFSQIELEKDLNNCQWENVEISVRGRHDEVNEASGTLTGQRRRRERR